MPITAPRKITTFLMFEGRAEEAMTLYTSLFEDARPSGGERTSQIVSITRYGPEGPGAEGTVQTAVFTLAGQPFMAIDSAVAHDFTFTPSVSLFVDCASEEEIDRLHAVLVEQGEELMALGCHGFSTRFGWLRDRFGVSWQLNLP
jgi:predicted 3-demethylubiquinone-9 3-methyltransferase (glyoxalase superfamily)